MVKVLALIPPGAYEDLICVPWVRLRTMWAWATRVHAVFGEGAALWPRAPDGHPGLVDSLQGEAPAISGVDLLLIPAALYIFGALVQQEGHDVTLVHVDDCLRAYREGRAPNTPRAFDVVFHCVTGEGDEFVRWLQAQFLRARGGVLVPTAEEARRLAGRTRRQRLFEETDVPTLPTLCVDEWTSPTETRRLVKEWWQGGMPEGFAAKKGEFAASSDGKPARLLKERTFPGFAGAGAIVRPVVTKAEVVRCVVVGGPVPACSVSQKQVCAFAEEVVAKLGLAYIARVDVVRGSGGHMVVDDVEWGAGVRMYAGTGVPFDVIESAGGLVPETLVKGTDRAKVEATLDLLASAREALIACLRAYTGAAAPCPGEKCFRMRRGCSGVNPWIEFRVYNAGRGLGRAAASQQYREAKEGRRKLIGAPYNVDFGDKHALCEFTRARQMRGRETARAPRFANHGNTCWLNSIAHLLRATGLQHTLPAAVRAFMGPDGGTRQQAHAVARLLGLAAGVQQDAHEALVHIINNATQELRNALAFHTRAVREAPGHRSAVDAVEYVMLHEMNESVQGMFDSMGATRTVVAQLGRHPRFQETITVRPPLPRFLIIALKRTLYPAAKVRDAVEADDVIRVAGAAYRLSAIVVHLGATPRSGHYVAHVRDAGGWMRYDDLNVAPSTGPRAQEVQRDSYVLLYAKQ